MKVEIVLLLVFFFNTFVVRGRSSSIIKQEAELRRVSTGGEDIATVGEESLNASKLAVRAGTGTFSVKSYGAKSDGKTDDSKSFQLAWQAACGASGSPKLLIPPGTYLVGPIEFTGPCSNAYSGNLIATTNLAQYGKGDYWILFSWVNGLNFIGAGGTFDGQGASAWPKNQCSTRRDCVRLPVNLLFVAVTNSVVRNLRSVNSKSFHIGMVDCTNIQMFGLNIIAPGNSPNTDGIHIERSSWVTIEQSLIATGDDCVSIGQGSTHVTISGVTCGPGHGISIGSLGRYLNEGDVRSITVKFCNFTGTMNGVRIKTWQNSPSPSVVNNITFDNNFMNNVGNPIIIDQTYCPSQQCAHMAPSRVKLQDITFRNIRGTTSTPEAVKLICSSALPCQNVILQDINLQYSAGSKSECQNVYPRYAGIQIPPPCGQ
ncbi:hypothetical protein IFM89_031898 [Coptis chinensis]|uniref:Polygalacturonase n=1 Tax=Coptis chinensis TaxID=261450 RepID=A0A835MCY1_9MAGN|nr:hypothetical protein IFM89_031898 [Coptis chinensis]